MANAGSNTLLHNNRDGTFTDATADSGISKPPNTLSVGAAWFDYDNDRLLDLVVSDYTSWTPETDFQCADSLKRDIYCSPTRYVSVPNPLYHNRGNGRFEDVTEQSGLGQARGKGMGVLFAGDRGRSFRYVSPSTGLGRLSYRFGGWGAGFIDYDNDGWKDLYSAIGDVDYLGDNASQSDTMFRNLEGKSFAGVSPAMGVAFTRKGFHRGSAFSDLDNDGSLDIVVTGINERPRIPINAGTAGAHWLLLDLQGTRGSRDAIGAKIKVTTASGRTLHNHVSVSTGLMSSSDRRVHFGLGAESVISSIEIRWPGGRVQTCRM